MTKKSFYVYRSREECHKFKRQLVDELGGKCIDCGYSGHLAALDFDHVDPQQKKYAIGQKLHLYTYFDIIQEVKKCVVRCSNCHRIKTHPTATFP